MKVNKIFHWLYFLMLLLPIFAIPMYAIYVRNENSTFAQEISVQENKVVDFNQLLDSYLYNEEQGNLSYDNGNYTYTYDYITNGTVYAQSVFSNNIINFEYGNKYLLKFNLTGQIVFRTLTANLFFNANSTTTSYIYYCQYNENSRLYFGQYDANIGDTFTFKYLQLFNLTQMFGSGNEPTIEQFNQWYPNDYYEYTLSDKQLLKAIDQTTYNDTDVGSQFTYTIYNSIDKYFNYDKVFNFFDLYDWLQLNFFNGNAPLGFFIFWHYLIYFLLTSLLWLLFDVLMYVPNLIHKWLDKAS